MPLSFEEQIRRRAKIVVGAALCGAGATAVVLVANWMALTALGNPLAVVLVDLLKIPAFAVLLVAAIFLIVNVISILRLLSKRAITYEPQLARSATDIHTMHMWPVRNIPGPVTILAETGVAPAMGPGRYIWYLSCLLWPVGLLSLVLSDFLKSTQQALVLICLAFITTAITASLLRRILAPDELSRAVPVGDLNREAEPAFWSKGIIEANQSRTPQSPLAVPIDDAIDNYYQRP